MKHILLGLLLASLGAIATPAQTTYNLTNSLCAIQASNYLFCSQMGTVTMGGTNYAVTSVITIPAIYMYPVSGTVTDATVTFRNTTTDVENSISATGTYTDHVVTLNFSGLFAGTLVFDFVQVRQTPPCWRGCRAYYLAESAVLTAD